MSPSRQSVATQPRAIEAEARRTLLVTPPSPRRFKSSRNRLLEAATEVFAARGYKGASTQRIAERAGVNQATVFRIFNSKQELYLEVLECKLGEDLPPWLVGALGENPDHEKAFCEIAERLQILLDPTFVRLLLAGGLEQPHQLKKCLRPRLLTFYSVLREYIQEHIRSGDLRDLDPTSMALALVGMVFYERIFNDLFGGRELTGPNSGRIGKTFTNIWLHGVLRH